MTIMEVHAVEAADEMQQVLAGVNQHAQAALRESQDAPPPGLSQALGAALDLREALHALLAHVVPALAANAIVAVVDEHGVIEQAATRSRLPDAEPATGALVPSALPSAHFALLRQALDVPAWHGVERSFVNGALRMLPLLHAGRLLGALWIDGELGARGAAWVEEAAARAAMAFATLQLHAALHVQIAGRRQAERQLEEADRRKDEFLAMLAHELRNPLAPIRNAVELIRLAAPVDAKVRWAADVTDRQVHQLTRLVDDLLDAARISRGKVTLQMQRLDLVTLASQCVESFRDAAAQRDQTLTLSLPDAPLALDGDAVRLAQVVNNLLSNAVKYTPQGGHIAVRVAPGEAADTALLEVTDNGIGIDPELLPNVFELFEQGKRGLDRTQGGLGVGLTLVQRLVCLHGGEVVARSAGIGQGAQFRISLPRVAPTASGGTVAARAHALPAAAVARRILVVDDNADVVETTTMLLSLSGHQVRSAKDGLQALQLAADFRPEVVLLDIGLPLMDGYEVARRLRQAPQTAGALMIALTGYGQQGDRQRGKEAGFDAHLLKPVDPHTLAALIAG